MVYYLSLGKTIEFFEKSKNAENDLKSKKGAVNRLILTKKITDLKNTRNQIETEQKLTKEQVYIHIFNI